MREHEEELGTTRPPTILRWIPLGILLVVIAIIGSAYLPDQAPVFEGNNGPRHPAVGTEFNAIQLQPLTQEGEPLTSADLQGKVILMNFWGPWCGPCGVEFPHLVELQQSWKNEPDFAFVSVSCTGRPGDELGIRDSTVQFLKQHRASFPVYRDANARTRDKLMRAIKAGTAQDFMFPTSLILDREGVIQAFWSGYTPGDELEMQEVVRATLKRNSSPSPPSR